MTDTSGPGDPADDLADVGGGDLEDGAATGSGGGGVRRSTRKRTHRDQSRRRSVNLRYDDEEYAIVAAAALRADLSPTAYVATAALAAARGTEVPGTPIREALTELMQARTAAVRIGVAVNKLAAKALAGGEVTAGELAAAAEASARAVARVEAVADSVHRRMA